MGLEAGTQLGVYTIVAPLGAGGMGEVYRATDTKLHREVALKVLPDVMAHDGERVARFEREARLLASLSHQQIAAIYGFEEAEGKRFLVLELVEGLTLADRLAGGPLTVEEALDIARQIAVAFEAAHEKNVIHRDLKPANVKIRLDGTVKVLDFGLAKALADESAEQAPGDSPTVTRNFTQPGVILGTAAYMSPEQARGRSVDKRTDIWSFGCMLYECLTGNSLFRGETVTDSIGAILHKQPEWDRLPANTPPTVRLLLRRCLAKDREQRLRDIGDARIELEAAIADPTSSVLGLTGVAVTEGRRRPRRRVAAQVATFVAGAALAAVITQSLQPKPEPPPPAPSPPVQRVTITLPHRGPEFVGFPPQFDVSADGSLLAYAAGATLQAQQLYVRLIDQPFPTTLAGTDGCMLPVISPDGQWIAFYHLQDGKLKKISVRGGPPTTLCDAEPVVGMTWTVQGDIVFCQPIKNAVYRVGENGGEPEQVVVFDDAAAPFYPYSPHVLPDGSAVLISGSANLPVTSGKPSIKAHSFATGQTTDLIEDAGFPLYAESGHLLFLRESTLMAAAFDPKRLDLTPPVPLVEDVRGIGPWAHVRITRAGNLFFRTGGVRRNNERRLVLLDATGKITSLNKRTGDYREAALSPDGERVAMVINLGHLGRTRLPTSSDGAAWEWS